MDATYFAQFCLVAYQDDFDGYTQPFLMILYSKSNAFNERFASPDASFADFTTILR